MIGALSRHLGIADARPVSGGCIHRCYRGMLAGRAVFLKVNDARLADAFAAEADGLAALRAAGCTAPEPISHGAAGGVAYLLMEFLELESRGDFAALGRMLATIHRTQGGRFGWARDNYIGSTPQLNGAYENWAEFWRARRLEPQLALAKRNGYELDADNVVQLLEAHAPAPSLLHGDLWNGNAGFLAGGAPVLFDPAVYYGDREADLAMTELFGGFPREFYSAYGPLPAGYQQRKHLYNLYHLLNHLNLFGGGYLGQVKATLRLLARAL
ncbi:MAG: fructosamine kinase family protein [Betaproteobacteria bacterium]|nr:MAG: fructosamine kinase family protein [Betaproteobacteria bacterium]